MGEIEAAQEVEVAFDAVGIVDVVVEEEAQQIGLAALDLAFELVRGVGVVADEEDLPHRELVALRDLEHEIDALVPGADGFRIDAHREVAALAVKLDDALGIAVDHGARERPARFRLHRFLEVLVLDLLVALECHPLDRRIFDDLDQNAILVPGDGHVLEQPSGIKALERRIERRRIELSVGAGVKMRADHRSIDVLVAGNGDRGFRPAGRERARVDGGGKKQQKAI